MIPTPTVTPLVEVTSVEMVLTVQSSPVRESVEIASAATDAPQKFTAWLFASAPAMQGPAQNSVRVRPSRARAEISAETSASAASSVEPVYAAKSAVIIQTSVLSRVVVPLPENALLTRVQPRIVP